MVSRHLWAVEIILLRITSYNVCYTKLLREVHRDRDQAEAERLAERLDEGGRDRGVAGTVAHHGDGHGEDREDQQEDQHRGVLGNEALPHALNPPLRAP